MVDRPYGPGRHARPRKGAGRHARLRRPVAALILAAVVVAGGAVGLDKLTTAAPASSSRQTTTPTPPPKATVPGPATRQVGATRPAPSGPASTAVAHQPVLLSAVGDTDLGTTGDLPPDPAAYLDPVRSALAAPIEFGNLEGTLSTDTSSKCGAGSTDCFAFQDPPPYARYLRADGFNVLNSANNHSDDFGPAGVAQTSAALRSAGIVQAGLPGQIGVMSDGGTKVAFVDFAPYTTTNDLLDAPAAKRLITRAKTLAPVVIVYMHAGAEGSDADHVTGADETYLGEDRGDPETFAHAAIGDGASAVIASGPHVLRGMQFYEGHLIAYSLGNFAGYRNFATEGDLDLSGILHLRLSATGTFQKASWTSLVLNADGQPAVDASGASAKFVNGLSNSDFGSSAAVIRSDGSIFPA
jgi:hypothetical protein